MKIALVIPASSLPFTSDRKEGSLLKPQVGPLALAAVLEGDHEVQILDSQLHQCTPEQMAQKVIDARPDVLGLSVNFSTLWKSAEIIADAAHRELGPEVPVVWGGNVATFNHEQALRSGLADIVVLNEADLSFPHLLREYERGGNWQDTPGIAFMSDGKLIRNAFGGYVPDLDTLPIPSYDHFEDPARYQRAVVSTRGCPYNCMYCSTKAMWGKWRYRSANSVLRELKQHVDEAAPERIAFIDDNFPVNRDRVKDICDGIIKAGWGFDWGFSARIELTDRALLDMCSAANCTSLFFGVESGSERVLGEMNRRYTPEDVIRVVDDCLAAGIMPTLSFMLGLPHETEEDVEMTFSLIEDVNTPMVQLHVLTPLIGTPVYEEPDKYGISFHEHDPELDFMDSAVFHDTAHLSRDRIQQLYLIGKGIVAERIAERTLYYEALRDARDAGGRGRTPTEETACQ